jgi:hypothetical protein
MDAYDRYWKLSEMEERFNASSGGIRTLASGWLLASLAAIGWLLDPSRGSSNWLVPVGLLVCVVSSLSVAGIATLWVLDHLVFKRLLNSVFLVGLRMEKLDPALPPIRTMMLKTMAGRGTYLWEMLFYVAPIFVFTALSIGVVTIVPGSFFAYNPFNTPIWPQAVAGVLVLSQILIAAWVIWNQRLISLETRAAWFGDDEFTRSIRDRTLEQTIGAWRYRTLQSDETRSEPMPARAGK